MKFLKELIRLNESAVNTKSAISQLVYNTNKLSVLYNDTLTDRVQRMYESADHDDMWRTVRKVLGQVKGKWFSENYLSSSRIRSSGIKDAISVIMQDPAYKSMPDEFKKMGSFVLNMNKQKQKESGGSGSNYVDIMADGLPNALLALAKLVPDKETSDTLKTASTRLKNAVNKFDTYLVTTHNKWDKVWGSGATDKKTKADIEKEEQEDKALKGAQSAQVEDIINHVLKSIDKKNANEIRHILARGGDKLAMLQRELTKRNIKL